MITAYATLEMAIEATKRGAHDVLPKPFTPDDLRVALRRAVRHYLVQREVVLASIETVAAAAAGRGVHVELHGPERAPLLADRSELEIILNNLVSNAVKYNRDGGRVDVTIERPGDDRSGWRIRVADTGIGLSPEDAARLFQEFVRVKNEDTRGIAGTGLGLSIVRRLAQLYGGDATVASERGVGSTFTVTLNVC